MVEVRLEHIKKTFHVKGKDINVLKDVNLTVPDHKFVVILAPSGEGKTTLLRIIAGLETTDSGKVYIGEKVVNDYPPKDRKVAMVFQNYAIYPFMTVYDNIAFPLKIAHVKKELIDKKVKEAAKMLQISDLLDRKPSQISGGQRQRVAICRAIVKGADVLLLDEPLSNLDAQLRTLARAELKELQRRLKLTTIYVTHDQVEAMVLADYVAILHNGVIEDFDTPINVYKYPIDTWVASFIGNPPMNLIEGKLEKDTFKFGGFSVKIPKKIMNRITRKTSRVIFGIRPEDIKLNGSVKGKVEIVEPLGSQTLVHVNAEGTLIKLIIPAIKLFKSGDKISLNLSSENAALFDQKDQKLILKR
ncbi:MAG: ABC transporter ATP-binding protein [Nanoarchaeota archaeon]|nr:ABC transporter ATP-binding protein [Nanoarchaeota archaeon]